MSNTSLGVNGHSVESVTDRRTEETRRETLLKRLETREAVIGVVGLGYVGLPLALAYAEQEYRTIGVDLDQKRVAHLNNAGNHIQDIDHDVLRTAVGEGYFTATSRTEAVRHADIVFICVPTPVTSHKDPDTSYIESAARAIAEHLHAGQLIILKSTTHPNTTKEVVGPILEEAAAARDLALGEDYFLAYSPERIDPGNKQFTTSNTPVVVGGMTEACTQASTAALEQITEHVHAVSNPQVGEMAKLLENIFRSVNIALVNEMAQMCDRIGDVSIWEVIEAAATKPFGFMPFYPGPGLGGHCIPIDPYYLSWLAREYDFETSFITLSARVNEEMPFYVRDAVVQAIAEQPVELRSARVLILGVAFKRNVDDIRHSPALKIIELLEAKGIDEIAYSDPHVPTLDIELSGETTRLQSVDLSPEVIEAYDVTVIVTDHERLPYEMIAEHATSIVDTRNALDNIPHDREKVVLLGGGRR